MTDKRGSALGVQIAFALWVIAFGLSLALAANVEPIGSGFTRGMNRIGTFFRWQFLAFAMAILTWLSARDRTDLSKLVRLTARVPITIQCLLGLAGAVVVILAVIFK